MQELEIIDLGDAMLETRCVNIITGGYDSQYGPSRWSC